METFSIGSHMSAAGGVDKAVERGAQLGCTAIQVFTRSNRQWSFDTEVSQATIDQFRQRQSETRVSCVVSHAAYLINIGSPKKETEDKSVRSLIAEMERCGKLGIPYVVFHPGSATDGDKKACIRRIARNIDTIMQHTPDNVWLLIETMAGQGSSVGHRFSELAEICDQTSYNRNIGFCFDTCHAFAAGYAFDTPDRYQDMWDNFDAYLGLDRLHVIHINDSQKSKGSRVDRHEHIGQGRMGIEPFRLLMNDKRFFHIPKILETPKDNAEDDIRNLRLLYHILDDQHKREIKIQFPIST